MMKNANNKSKVIQSDLNTVFYVISSEKNRRYSAKYHL